MTSSIPPLRLYADFNCPYSALANYRASWLEAAGHARVDVHLVQHLPDHPAGGDRVQGDLARLLRDEVREVRGLLTDGEVFPLRVPPRRPNTARATRRYAASLTEQGWDRARGLRVRIFRALWLRGQDVSDPQVLDQLGAPPEEAPTLAHDWQEAWARTDRPVVPMLVLPDGYVSRGLGALTRLQRLRFPDPA